MFVMVTSTFPPHKQPEVAPISQKMIATPLPPFVKRLYLFARPDLESGVKSFSILEVEAGKEGEGLQAIYGSVAQYAGIEGFRYSVDIVGDTLAAAAQAAQTA